MDKIKIVLTHRINIFLGNSAKSLIPANILEEIRMGFVHTNPAYSKSAGTTRDEEPFFTTWSDMADDEGNWLTVPRGGMSRVRKVLKDNGLSIVIEDRRCTGDVALSGKIPAHKYTLHPFQNELVDAAIEKQNCIVRAPTGSGKTTCGFSIASRLNLPTLVILDDSNLFEQWVKRAVKELGMHREDIGIVRGPINKWTIGPITVAMAQTLYAHPEFWTMHGTKFGVVIRDEVQRAAATTFFAATDLCPAKYRIGISADETRHDEKEFLVYDQFGSVAFEVSQDELIKDNFVLDVEIVVVPTNFVDDNYKNASGKRRMFLRHQFMEKMGADKARNKIVADLVSTEAKKGQPCIVWAERVEHCRMLDNDLAHHGVRSGLLLGGQAQRKRFEVTARGLMRGDIHAGVGTVKATSTGIDMPALSRGILTAPMAGNRQLFGQTKGRLCRTGDKKVRDKKHDARLYYLFDRFVFGRKHLENLNRWFSGSVQVLMPGGKLIPALAYLQIMKANGNRRVEPDLSEIFS